MGLILGFFLVSIVLPSSPRILASEEDYIILYPTDDSWIRMKDPTNNYGSSDQMIVRNRFGHSSHPDYWEEDIVIRFDLSDFPSHLQINSASLHLYYYEWNDNNPEGNDLSIYRITSNWDENSVTWDTRPSVSSVSTSSTVVPSSSGHWMSWEVTDDVQDFLDGFKTNFGWQIVDENYWGGFNVPRSFFRTKESGSFVPYLEIETCSKVIMEDVIFNEIGVESGLLKCEDISTPVCSGEWKISYDPMMISINDVMGSDFGSVHWYNNAQHGILSIVAMDADGLTGDFAIAQISLTAVGSVGDSTQLIIEDSEMLTCDPIPNEVSHFTDDGMVSISSPINILMEDICISKGSSEGKGFLKVTDTSYNVGSVEIILSYNPSLFTISSVDNGDFEVIYWYVDESEGTLTIIGSNSNIAVSGDFTIAELTVEGIACPIYDSPLSIIDSELLTDNPQPINLLHSTDDGCVCSCFNCIAGDMNGDCSLNSADVRYLALYLAGDPLYGTLCGDGDVNNDGRLNSGDVRYLALYLAGNPDYSPLYP